MKQKTKRQVAYLLSKSSPLDSKQQQKLKKELHSGAVKMKDGESGCCGHCGGKRR